MAGNGFSDSHSCPLLCSLFPCLPIPIPNIVTYSYSHDSVPIHSNSHSRFVCREETDVKHCKKRNAAFNSNTMQKCKTVPNTWYGWTGIVCYFGPLNRTTKFCNDADCSHRWKLFPKGNGVIPVQIFTFQFAFQQLTRCLSYFHEIPIRIGSPIPTVIFMWYLEVRGKLARTRQKF